MHAVNYIEMAAIRIWYLSQFCLRHIVFFRHIVPPYSFRHILPPYCNNYINYNNYDNYNNYNNYDNYNNYNNYDNYDNYDNYNNYNKYYAIQLCILTNCTCNIRQNSKKPMLISLNLIANPGDPNNRRKPLEIRNDPFPPVSSKVNLVNARELLDSCDTEF